MNAVKRGVPIYVNFTNSSETELSNTQGLKIHKSIYKFFIYQLMSLSIIGRIGLGINRSNALGIGLINSGRFSIIRIT